MESGRLTRRKGSSQSNSIQPSTDSKNTLLSQEKQMDLSSTMQYIGDSSKAFMIYQ